MKAAVKLVPLEQEDREQFVTDNQVAFRYGAMEEFGVRDDHLEEDGEIISRRKIKMFMSGSDVYRIMQGDQKVGGMVVNVDGDQGELYLMFVAPELHNQGVGYAAWCAVEEMYPQVKVWDTITPYYEHRNVHFYVNCCGFHIVEYFNPHHWDPSGTHEYNRAMDKQFPYGLLRFEKMIK